MTSASAGNFPTICRQWRHFRKLSQLDLALAADVSQRHLSWLETGRSQPSREMVVRLSEAMEIPLRERNVLLQSAGFAAAYGETDLDDPQMSPVLDALNKVLEHHEPLPAVVVDRLWNVRRQNQAANLLLSIDGNPDDMLARTGCDESMNLARLTLHPEGLRPYISNWSQVAPGFIRRLDRDAKATGDSQVQAYMDDIIRLAGDIHETHAMDSSLLPVLPLELEVHGLKLSLFSVISTFGTPQDVTTDELRIEAFYPGDDATASFFRSAASAAT